MEQGMFITAQEVAVMLGVSKSKAYAVVRELNRELSDRGFITISGKGEQRFEKRSKFFEEKFYGIAG